MFILNRILFFLPVLLFCIPAAAQKSENRFTDRLWYGGGIGLGFVSFSDQSAFTIGISPMVGYKILPFLSAGPRISEFYTAQKVLGYGTISLFDTEVSAFVRARIIRGIFAQVETGNQWRQSPVIDTNGELNKITYTRTNNYLGLGFNSGSGGFGSEVALFYNVSIADDIYTSQNPLSLRFALTWRF